MALALTLIPVESVAIDASYAHVRCADPRQSGYRLLPMPVYPESLRGKKLRRRRLAWNLTLRGAASLLGLSPSEYSGLEFGWFTLSEADWAVVFEAVTGV